MPPPTASAPRKPWWKSIKGWFREYQWPLVALVWLAALILGYIGFSDYWAARGEQRTPWDVLYLSIQLFVLESGAVGGPVPWQLEVARLLAPAVAMWTVIQGLAIIFAERLQAIRLRLVRDHVVVCGLSAKGLELTDAFRDDGLPVVVIEKDSEHDDLDYCRERGAIVITGDATRPEVLARARVGRARLLFAVCGDDGVNARVAAAAAHVCPPRGPAILTCFVHIVDCDLCRLLRDAELTRKRHPRCRLEFFNIYETGARVLLNAFPASGTDPARGHKRPAIIVIGLGRFGSGVVLRAARDWRATGGANGRRLRVIVIDRSAHERCDELRWDHPHVERYAELVPLELDVASARFRRSDFLSDVSRDAHLVHAYICLDNDSLALSTALDLRHQRIRHGCSFPIVVRMTRRIGLAQLVRLDSQAGGDGGIDVFPLIDEACRTDILLGGATETIARAIHNDYLAREIAKGTPPGARASMVPWDDLPEHLKESNRHQAAHVAERLRACGYRLAPLTDWDADQFTFEPDEIELMARMEHERWCTERRAVGYKYGPERDERRKTHPDLVPWQELSEEEKQKDRDMVVGLPAFLARAGFQIEETTAR